MLAARLGKGTAGTSPTTVFTASDTVIVKSISLCNIIASTAKVTLSLGGTNVLYNYAIPPQSSIIIPLDQIITSTETVVITADTASSVDYFISGKTGVNT